MVGLLLAVAFLQARGQRPAGVREREQAHRRDHPRRRRRQPAAGAQRRPGAAGSTPSAAARLEGQAESGLADRVAALGLVTGAAAVTGPGVVLTVDDAEQVAQAGDGSDPRADTTADDGRVLDADLQVAVNGLWQAGAEAVSVNGQRLTALSAIRSAGQAVLVDYRPLAPPYVVQAIGDPGTLQTRFSDGSGGRSLQYLKDNYGVRFGIAPSDSLTLPASAGLTTRRAQVPGSEPTASAGATGASRSSRTSEPTDREATP
ncbi:hypothetical protein GCM10025868_45020 [Angustibacter aerolatus]|uniref:DUF881 domain-containing protein n=1 Tax=Angustibacter aerolatus TaxID=1162965 RepID=A0ABQ6JQZ9_9ACTN|nr:DUF881 domain-containing protein [Angustibacter aerolatus]GMA89252.1 hypothetical protein GCM10025868_45020 [Angustibacter aerolatus]